MLSCPTSSPVLRIATPRNIAFLHNASSFRPASRSYSSRSRKAGRCLRLGSQFKGPQAERLKNVTQSRAYASAFDGNKREEVPSLRHHTLTLLHKTLSLLPRTLPPEDICKETADSLQLWEALLSQTYARLSDAVALGSKVRIGVCGIDSWAGSQELLTALLEDPFASDDTQSNILHARWKSHPKSLDVEYWPSTSLADTQEKGKLAIPSSWLQQFPLPVQIIEMHPVPLSERFSEAQLTRTIEEITRNYLDTDLLVLLCNPALTPLSTLFRKAKHLLSRQNTILALTSLPSDVQLSQISKFLSGPSEDKTGGMLAIDPNRALNAVRTLKAEPTSSTAIQKYQINFAGSKVSALTDAITRSITAMTLGGGDLSSLRTQVALVHINSTLEAGYRSIEAERRDINAVCQGISELRAQVEEIRAKAEVEVLGSSEVQGDGEDSVKKAMTEGGKEMKLLLDSLTWWKMIWKVDEVGSLVGSAVNKAWCRDLKDQLILHTGRLSSIQERLTSSTFALLSKLSPPATTRSFHSPLIVNELQQLSSSPSYRLISSSLIQPLSTRQGQLVDYSTTRLHLAAQQAALGTFGGVLGGSGLGWWLGFGENIIGMPGTEVGTAVGIGMLGTVVSIRWAVGKWERAKRRWMQDWNRVGDGLRRDLKDTLQKTVDNKVVIVASQACERLDKLVEKRQDEVGEIEDELGQLECNLQALREKDSRESSSQ